MKRQLKLAALVLLSILNVQLSTAFAQGGLTPPGPPAPIAIHAHTPRLAPQSHTCRRGERRKPCRLHRAASDIERSRRPSSR